jgi:hypothetical protein
MRLKHLVIPVFLAGILLLTPAPTRADEPLRGNAAAIVLTPPLAMKYTLGGYGARMSKPAEGIHDDIRIKALVLSHGTEKYALVTADILGFPPNIKPMLVKRLNDPAWREENILLLPSHSHTSLEMFALNDRNIFNNPAIGIFQPALLDYVLGRLALAIRTADSNLQPVLAGTSSEMLEGLNRNRRGHLFVDRELTVTRIDRTDGTPLAVLVNWTGHPTIMDEHDMWVSAGWPGYLQRELEGCIGQDVVAMYYNGAEGDQSVIAHDGASHYEKAERYGRTLAVHALRLYKQILPEKDSLLGSSFHTIDLPPRQPHPDFMATAGKEYGLSPENIMILLNQVQPAQTHLAAFRLGSLLIACVPGEMTAEQGLLIKKQLKEKGIPHPVIGGLANEWISYILTEKDYEIGGYEAATSFYGKELGKTVTQALLRTALPFAKQKP